MGRKIPGRKHRGVRDPEKQALTRFNSIKDKINAPPTNPDVQEVSKTLQRIINLTNKTKNGEFKKKKKVKTNTESNNEPKINKRIQDPRFHLLPDENKKQYFIRINRICQDATREAAFQDKYGVEIKRNEDGEVRVEKRPKDELELLIKKIKKDKKEKKVKKKKTAENDTPRLTKSQKWQRKKKEKKLKKKLKTTDELETRRDSIKFGEIVHAPPTLTAPKKVQKTTNAPRPGQKNLLLSAIMQRSEKTPKNQATKEKVANKTIDKKGKRKDLPNALRRQLDKQQKEIMDAYKSLKAKKYSTG